MPGEPARARPGTQGPGTPRPPLGPGSRIFRFAEFRDDNARLATRLYESHPPRYQYLLTEKGRALRPVLKALYAWGERYG
jgi:hypothetical protein